MEIVLHFVHQILDHFLVLRGPEHLILISCDLPIQPVSEIVMRAFHEINLEVFFLDLQPLNGLFDLILNRHRAEHFPTCKKLVTLLFLFRESVCVEDVEIRH